MILLLIHELQQGGNKLQLPSNQFKKSIGFDQRNKARNICFLSKTPHNRENETHSIHHRPRNSGAYAKTSLIWHIRHSHMKDIL